MPDVRAPSQGRTAGSGSPAGGEVPAYREAGLPARRRARWWVAAVVAMATVAGMMVMTRADHGTSGPSRAACPDVHGRALDRLTPFTTWLDANHVEGVVGEVGWPSGHEWDHVATDWMHAATGSGIGVYVWGAAQDWPATYPLAVYRSAPDGALVAGPQATLLERLDVRTGPAGLRGVALADASFGAPLDRRPSDYSSAHPGQLGVDYRYPSTRFLEQLAARGIRSVRLAVMWERLQPRLFGPLAPVQVAAVRRVLSDATGLGMTVVVDLHNYGRYAEGTPSGGRTVRLLGSAQLPASALADLWRRLALALRGSPALAAYGLMNEPHDLPGGAAGWERTTSEVFAALRSVDPDTLVLVPGYQWSSAAVWAANHPRPWIQGSGVVYEAHEYFDLDGSGTYARSYAEESRLAARAPCPSLPSPH